MFAKKSKEALKVLVLGDEQSGKSQLIHQLMDYQSLEILFSEGFYGCSALLRYARDFYFDDGGYLAVNFLEFCDGFSHYLKVAKPLYQDTEEVLPPDAEVKKMFVSEKQNILQGADVIILTIDLSKEIDIAEIYRQYQELTIANPSAKCFFVATKADMVSWAEGKARIDAVFQTIMSEENPPAAIFISSAKEKYAFEVIVSASSAAYLQRQGVGSATPFTGNLASLVLKRIGTNAGRKIISTSKLAAILPKENSGNGYVQPKTFADLERLVRAVIHEARSNNNLLDSLIIKHNRGFRISQVWEQLTKHFSKKHCFDLDAILDFPVEIVGNSYILGEENVTTTLRTELRQHRNLFAYLFRDNEPTASAYRRTAPSLQKV